MTSSIRKKKVNAHVNERDFPFVVQIAVPDGGFECTLDAINAWHYFSRNPQYRGQHRYIGDQEFRSWHFEGLEIAKAFRHRFGGEILPVTIRTRTSRRSNLASRVSTAGDSFFGAADQDTEDKRAGSTLV